MPRRTAAEAAQTRRELVRAGIQFFTERAYSEAPLEDLVAQLGVTRGALYHHFGSKQGFFQAVVEESLHDLEATIVKKASQAGAGWPGLEAGCHAFLEAATRDSFRRIVLIEAPAALDWQTWRELDEQSTLRSLKEALSELKESGELIREDVTALAMGLSGAMNELALWVAAQKSPARALPKAKSVITNMLMAFRASEDKVKKQWGH